MKNMKKNVKKKRKEALKGVLRRDGSNFFLQKNVVRTRDRF